MIFYYQQIYDASYLTLQINLLYLHNYFLYTAFYYTKDMSEINILYLKKSHQLYTVYIIDTAVVSYS